QAQAARKTKGGQEANEADRDRRSAARGVPGHPAGRRLTPSARRTTFCAAGAHLHRLFRPMSALTAILYAVLAIYLGGWYADQWIRKFSLALLRATVGDH